MPVKLWKFQTNKLKIHNNLKQLQAQNKNIDKKRIKHKKYKNTKTQKHFTNY
jgi:hypothetical protein